MNRNLRTKSFSQWYKRKIPLLTWKEKHQAKGIKVPRLNGGWWPISDSVDWPEKLWRDRFTNQKVGVSAWRQGVSGRDLLQAKAEEGGTKHGVQY